MPNFEPSPLDQADWQKLFQGLIKDGSVDDPANRSSERITGVDPLFEELGKLDRSFGEWYFSEGYFSNPVEKALKAQEIVRAYAEAIKAAEGRMNEQVLLNEKNEMGGNVDPCFAYLLRAICGSTVITEQVYRRIRSEWCGSDLPQGLDELLKTKDDVAFVRGFQGFRLNEFSNLKLTALQQMGLIEQLVRERQSKIKQ